MYRSHNCGELRLENVHEQVTLSGWVQKVRNKGGMIWIDLRVRYGITQLALEDEVSSKEAMEIAKKLGVPLEEYAKQLTAMEDTA